jgi:hypothetical protein
MTLLKSNTAGFSIIEILLTLAISIIAISGATTFSIHYRKLIRQDKLATLQKEFSHKVSDVLSVSASCTPLLQKATQTLTPNVPSSATGNKILLDPIPFQESLRHPIFSVTQVELSITPETPVGDISKPASGQTYNGYMSLSLAITNPRFLAYKDLIKTISVPIFLYDEHSDESWTEIRCATSQSPDSFIVGQICNTYGGTLTDGMHCDLIRNLRKDDYPLNNIPDFQLGQDADNKTRRISISDVICYLDTLIIMTPPNPLSSTITPRNKTRFCRHPGTASLISKDAKEGFNDVVAAK